MEQRERTTEEYMAFARRILRAAGRRVAEGDIEALRMLAELELEVATTMQATVDTLKSEYSWAQIGEALHVTRESAWQRFGPKSIYRQMNKETSA